ncbi:hypothetical protein FRZ06_02900 [Anoxybacterium hadale]|uniref:Uncharacterized protein n=1 Tax=Anoxybacterium hadale TaxID=3408580 RepID=A0ACD1A7S9_9FIRM|nr:hypothetical protein FRZ06_02900 [Clostridiales bacterium]
MFKILVDTCVWLDLAKDYQQRAILTTLEELIHQGDIELILPRVVVDEFNRNKARIIEESSRSLSGTLKRVKEVIEKFGDPQKIDTVLLELNDVDHRLPILGEEAVDTIGRIEQLFACSSIIDISDAVKLRAAQRAIDKRAPFHRQRNGIDDAILIEVYRDAVGEQKTGRARFAFITYNTKDFSHPNASNKLPHPDIQDCFSKVKSHYCITLREMLQRIIPKEFNDFLEELEWVEEPRRLSEIVDAIDEFATKVWYNRHQIMLEKLEEGIIKIVDKETFPIIDHETRPIQRDILEGALRAANEVEKRFGIENLGPWDDFEWGMINGKLSALRWILGDEWDMLDT